MLFNFPLEVAVIAMVSAQLIKLPILYIMEKRWEPAIVFSTGGMPSSHSAFVIALVLGVALTEGVNGPFFAISFVLAGVVIHDAVGIRREAGRHAAVLNQMKEEYDVLVKEFARGVERDDLIVETKLKELLGHEPVEALTGTLFGAAIALVCYFAFMV